MYEPQPEQKKVYEKYLVYQKQLNQLNQADEKNRIKLKQKEQKKLEQEIKILENFPIMINQKDVLKKIQNIDRLKTIKFLSHMHLHIRKGLENNLVGEEQQAFQEYIDNDEQLHAKHQKVQKAKVSQKDDLLGKLDFNQKVLLKFIDQQQRIDMKFKDQQTQYENPKQYQMIENQEMLLEQQKNLETDAIIHNLEKKLQNQQIAKQQSNDEIQLIQKQIKNLQKDNELLIKQQGENALLLNMEQNQKDVQQKAQYALILQNKLDAFYSECQKSAHTHHLDLITILSHRSQDYQLQILKLEELLKDLCQRYNLELNIQKPDFQEFDQRLNTIYEQAEKAKKEVVQQKTAKNCKKKKQFMKKINEKIQVQPQQEHIIQHEIKEEIQHKQNDNQQNDQQSEQSDQEERIQIENKKKQQKQQKLATQKIQQDKQYLKLSVQDQLNTVLNQKDMSQDAKKEMIQQFQNQNKSLLKQFQIQKSKKDQNLLNNLLQMNNEDFQVLTTAPIILPSKLEQIKRKQEIEKKFQKEEIPIKNNYPVQKSRYLDQTKATLQKQKKIMFKEEMDNYFLDWRLKEYLSLKGVKAKAREVYIQMAKNFFIDMEMQLYDIERIEISKQLTNSSIQQENTGINNFDQTTGFENSVDNTMQSKIIKKDLQTESHKQFKPALNSNIKHKSQRIISNDEFSWVTPKTQLTLNQQFKYEIWLKREKRKNTIPSKDQYQDIINQISEQLDQDNE